MAERDLRHYNRKELIELLYESEKKNVDLEKSIQMEQAANLKLNDTLKDRNLEVTEAGNLADAVLKVNGVYQAAQAAAEDYLLNIKTLSEKQDKICAEREAKSRADANQIVKEASRRCAAMQKKTEEECWEMENETKRKCEAIKQQARQEVESYWTELTSRLENFCKAHEGMKEILSFYHMEAPKI